jgi:hypothetical protein
MMRSRFRTVLLMLVALSALGAFASASASAVLPEFKPARGKFPIKFEASTGAPRLERADGVEWWFTHVHLTGEISGPQTVTNVTFTFEEGHKPNPRCYSGPEKEHKLIWTNLTGRLGYLNKTFKSVGLRLAPGGQHFGECKWENIIPAEFVGALTGQLGEFSKMASTFNLKYQQTRGLQVLLALEGEKAAPLYIGNCPEYKESKCNGLPSEEQTVGLEQTFWLTFENSAKLKEEIKIEA